MNLLNLGVELPFDLVSEVLPLLDLLVENIGLSLDGFRNLKFMVLLEFLDHFLDFLSLFAFGNIELGYSCSQRLFDVDALIQLSF